MDNITISRRHMVLSLGASAVALATVGVSAVGAQVDTTWTAGTSANGWPVLDRSELVDIEGSGQQVALAPGAAATILTYVARRFHYEIDQLRPDDVQGHTPLTSIDQPYESNYLSGTAIAIRPNAYPVGVSDGFYPAELIVIRDILTELEGVVTWGGDHDVPKESHFEIALPPQDRRIAQLAQRILKPGTVIGEEPGAIDAFLPERMARANQQD
jgi:hypothetical protein